jgi:hypothetical protein
MWQVYAYLAHDLIETKRRDADRARSVHREVPATGQRSSLVQRLLPGRGHR